MLTRLGIISQYSFKTSATLVLLLLCVSTFSACGKKGNLYLPADPEPVMETTDIVPDDSKDLQKKSKDQ